jgi:hypothetical protein
MELLVKPEILTSYIYGPTFGNAERCLFLFTAQCFNINPLPVQFKPPLHGQEGCVYFSGHLNEHKYQYVLVLLGPQAAFKSSML